MIFEIPTDQYKQYDSYQGNGQSALLQAVKNSIAITYPSTQLRGDGQVVIVSFTDGITFEIVPGFLRAVDRVYLYPDTNTGGSWKITDPRAEIQAIRERNGACNGNLVQLCRMMRAWKDTWNVPIGGLLIDTLAYQFIENWPNRDKSFIYYDWMCRDFFKWISEQDQEQQVWRAPGSGSYVYRQGLFQYKAKQCYNIAVDAIKNETAVPKQEWAAKDKWRQIFGTRFPD